MLFMWYGCGFNLYDTRGVGLDRRVQLFISWQSIVLSVVFLCTFQISLKDVHRNDSSI